MTQANSNLTLGIDLGGTKIATAVVEVSTGNIVARDQIPTPTTGSKDVFAAMINITQPLLAQYPEITHVGVGSPGPLDLKKGEVLFSPNIKGMENAPIVPVLKAALDKEIGLENDANAAGYAEHLYGAAKNAESSIYITISTGIGGAIFLGKNIWRGAQGLAGEIGHMTLSATGSIGGDGISGGWEAIASGRAIAQEARYVLNQADLTTQEVFRLAAQGNRHATAIIDRAAQYTGIGIANLQKIFNPHVFVIGGGMSQVGDFYFDKVRYWLSHYLAEYPVPQLTFAQLGVDAGVIGAAAINY